MAYSLPERNPKVSILQEAAEIVAGPRQVSYGPPEKCLPVIASLWSAYLGKEVTAADVAVLNILQKIARERHRPKRDNRVDIAGYAELLDRVSPGNA